MKTQKDNTTEWLNNATKGKFGTITNVSEVQADGFKIVSIKDGADIFYNPITQHLFDGEKRLT